MLPNWPPSAQGTTTGNMDYSSPTEIEAADQPSSDNPKKHLYIQKWMGDREEDLWELKQLITSGQRTAYTPQSGYLTEHGWHSINDPNESNPVCPPILSTQFELCPPKDVEALSEEPTLDAKYFDPEYYLSNQDEEMLPSAAAKTVGRILEQNDGEINGGGYVPEDVAPLSGQSGTRDIASYFKSTRKGSGPAPSEPRDENRVPKETKAGKFLFDSETESSLTELDSDFLLDDDPIFRGMTTSAPTQFQLGGKTKRSSNGPIIPRPQKVSSSDATASQETTPNETTDGDNDIPKDQSKRDEWELVSDDTTSPRVGTPAPHKLRIHLRHKATRREKTLKFRMIKEADIDWNEPKHLKSIGQWRRQLFRRRGFPLKKVLFAPAEDAWLNLFHEKTYAVAKGASAIGMPTVSMVREAFNEFFEGKLLVDAKGNQLPAREARENTSFRGKFVRQGSKLWQLREDTRGLLDKDSNGKIYVPVITEEELDRYRESGIVAVDDPDNADKNNALAWSREKLEKLHQSSPRKRKRKQPKIAEIEEEKDTLDKDVSDADDEAESPKPTKERLAPSKPSVSASVSSTKSNEIAPPQDRAR